MFYISLPFVHINSYSIVNQQRRSLVFSGVSVVINVRQFITCGKLSLLKDLFKITNLRFLTPPSLKSLQLFSHYV